MTRTFTRRSREQERAALLDGLLTSGAWAAHGPAADPAELERHVLALTVTDPDVDSGGVLSRALRRALDARYEAGWQPTEVLHVVGGRLTRRVLRLAQELVVHAPAPGAPPEWAAQLTALGPSHTQAGLVVGDWVFREELGAQEGWRDGLRLLGLLRRLPGLEALGPVPSRWGRASTGRVVPDTAGVDPKVLARIRALLAKAESTSFPQEAEALSAKAQDLLTRHAIDAAVLAARTHQPSVVRARRVPVADPYAGAKVQLLDAVGRVNEVRVVWTGSVGLATVVGHPEDLELVAVLFASLLVQVRRAVDEAGRTGLGSDRRFRRGFLFAYAERIGQRLGDARAAARGDAARTYGAELVPVLAERSEAVETAFTALFPRVRAARRTRVDAVGWAAGTAAADRADLGT